MKPKVGFTCGAFDLMHVGHMLMLREAKEQCDHLVVGLHINPSVERPEKNKPVMSVEERMEMLKGCRYVDEMVLYKTEADLLGILQRMEIDVRIIGEDWLGKPYTGHELRIPVYFNSRNHEFSTTNLRRRVYEAELAKLKKT